MLRIDYYPNHTTADTLATTDLTEITECRLRHHCLEARSNRGAVGEKGKKPIPPITGSVHAYIGGGYQAVSGGRVSVKTDSVTGPLKSTTRVNTAVREATLHRVLHLGPAQGHTPRCQPGWFEGWGLLRTPAPTSLLSPLPVSLS